MAQVDYSIDPKKVSLKGDKAVLDDISSIVLDTISLQDLNPSQSLRYEIPIPKDTELVGERKEATVTIVVKGVSERRVSTTNFTCSNVPEGYEASVVTESLSVMLRGLSEEINALDGSDLLINADLSRLTGEGSFTVPASVQINGYNNVGVKGNYQVIVNVSSVQQPETELDPASNDGTRSLPEAQSAEPTKEVNTQEQAANA